MNNRKTHNSILVLATLGVYLGLVLIGAAGGSVFAQDGRPAGDIAINRRAFDEFARYVNEKAEDKDFDLGKPFSIKFDGYITNFGKFDLKKSTFIDTVGDPILIDLARRGIEAISDSGFLGYLQSLNIENTVVLISQDSDQIMSLSLRSYAKTRESARTIASGLNVMMQVGKMQTTFEDERYLFGNTSVTSDGSIFTINLFAPSAKVKELLLRK